MVNTSDSPITVDGVRLDTLAWNITKMNRATASRRSADVEVPGADGAIPSLNDTLAAGTFGLELWVRGTDADGAVPGGQTQRSQFWNNLDELVHLFGKRHGLLVVTETVAGTVRRALAKVTDTITPDVNEPGGAGTFSVAFSIPAGCWEDETTADWDSGAVVVGGGLGGTAMTVTTLTGATERNTDAVVVVLGPANNPRVTNPASGAYVQLNRVLTGSESWRVNLATWSSRYGAGLTVASADTAGTDGSSLTTYGGAQSVATYLALVPVRTSPSVATRITQVILSATGGITTATRLTIRARRKYAL